MNEKETKITKEDSTAFMREAECELVRIRDRDSGP